MSAIEQRARELLAQAFGCDEGELSKEEVRAARVVLAWQETLTPAEGYVLVPVEPTEAMVNAATEAYMPFGDMEFAIQSAISARPEAP